MTKGIKERGAAANILSSNQSEMINLTPRLLDLG